MWPRPLPLHLMSGMMSQTATSLLGQTLSLEAPDPQKLAEMMAVASQALTQPEKGAEAAQQVQQGVAEMLRGIELYQRHGWQRPQSQAALVWQQGAARLLDFGGEGARCLVVPSLVNRSDVLDLTPERSLMQWLAEQGTVRPMMLDWGGPGDAERSYGLSDYITGPLCDALEMVTAQAEGPVDLVGYCMGGDLALAAAQLWPDRVRRLVLLATPWDFHADLSPGGKMFADNIAMWQPVLDAMGELPVDLLQAFFASLDPGLVQRKFARFASMDMNGPDTHHFVAVEDWVNDGVALAPRVAMETLGGWFRDNSTARGRWLVDGTVIDPAKVGCPAFVAIPSKDRIVPPASSEPLAAALPDVTVHHPGAGHIGMIVSGKARQELWQPLQAWFTDTA